MCIREYTLEVCPYCSSKKIARSENKLFENETEVKKDLRKCDQIKQGRRCFDSPGCKPIRELWVCSKDSKGRDFREITACLYHTPKDMAMRSTDRANRKALWNKYEKASKLRANKLPKVVWYERNDGAHSYWQRECDAEYFDLKLLGVKSKADLEYDDPKDLEEAKRDDAKQREHLESAAIRRGELAPPPYTETT